MGIKQGCLSATSCVPSTSSSSKIQIFRRHLTHKHVNGSTAIETTVKSIPHTFVSQNKDGNQININHANEDELMLLPGINRRIAQNIIEHRRAIGGFKNLEDIALVNGIGADLFTMVCSDICVDNPRQTHNFYIKSPSSMTMTLPTPQRLTTVTRNNQIVNINIATFNELRTIPGLRLKLIERIIRRREKKGPFRFVEDLLKVKGFNYMVLASIRPYVTVDHRQVVNESNNKNYYIWGKHNDNTAATGHYSAPTTPSGLSPSGGGINSLYPTLNRNNNNSDSLSVASLLFDTLPSEIHTILFSNTNPLLQRQILAPISQVNDESKIRFASWNLQQLNLDKVKNPGVREVICRTILEHNINLIGIQEIGHKEALDPIVDELNNPTLPLIKEWSGNGPRRRWKYTISNSSGKMFQGSEYFGYIYDESANITLKKASLLPLKEHFTRLPYIAVYKIHNIEIVLVNVHLKARRLDENVNDRTKDEALSLSLLAEAMKDAIEQKVVVIFGDFNHNPKSEEFEPLIKHGFSYLINDNTNISIKTPNGSTCVDNMWLSAEAKEFHSGCCGVIRDNLTSPWIPNGWSWGGLVSDHCPIWTDFNLPDSH